MLNPSALVQQHAAAIINALVETLDAPDGRDRLKAAKLLLLWGWGSSARRRRTSEAVEVVAVGGLSAAEQQQAVDLLLPHLRPAAKVPKRSATSCPARQRAAQPPTPPPANPAINPMSLEPDTGAAAATADPPSAILPNPSINPMSREPSPSPRAAPPGTESSRRDADPMSRAVLPARHSDDPFYRPLPQPAPVEPPWPLGLDYWPPHRRRRWT